MSPLEGVYMSSDGADIDAMLRVPDGSPTFLKRVADARHGRPT
jgi:hypothetical protein